MQEIRNSYNNYRTYNSSSVHNVNSNNVIGSHNRTETNVRVENSEDVRIGVENNTSTTNNMANDSFNRDSYNTRNETNTTIFMIRSTAPRTLTIRLPTIRLLLATRATLLTHLP